MSTTHPPAQPSFARCEGGGRARPHRSSVSCVTPINPCAGRLDLAGGIGVTGSAVLEEGTLVAGGAPFTGLSAGAGGLFTLSGGTLESNWTSVSGTWIMHDGLLTTGVLTVDLLNGAFVQEGGTVVAG